MECLECHETLIQTQGKRQKTFCNNTCRSKYWQRKRPKTAKKMKWVVTAGGLDISDKCTVDPKTWTLTIPDGLLLNEPKTINVDYSNSMPILSFMELMNFAKAGNPRRAVEYEVSRNTKLSPAQISSIYSKTKL